MGTKQVTVGTSKGTLVNREETRSAILICNSHPSAILYISDEGDISLTSGYMIFPKTALLLSYNEGVEVEKKFLAISDTATTIVGIWEWFKRVKVKPEEKPDIQEPDVAKDPSM